MYTFLDYPGWLTPVDSVISGITPLSTRDTSFVVVASNGKLNDTLVVDLMVENPSKISNGELLPLVYSLNQNYPNPFNPSTTICFSLPKSDNVLLKIYDLLGNEIETLTDGKLLPGNYYFKWTPKKNLSSGIYLYRLKTGNFMDTKTSIYLK
jgi:hypothetical protein